MRHLEVIKMSLVAVVIMVAMVSPALDVGFSFLSSRSNSIYRVGETAIVTIAVTNGMGMPMTTGRCRVAMDNFGSQSVGTPSEFDLSKGNPFVVKGRLRSPGFLRFVIDSIDAAGEAHHGLWAVGFDTEKLRPGSRRPEDFDAFWDKAVAAFEREEQSAPRIEKDVEASSSSHDCYRLWFATVPVGRLIRGQMTVPKGKGPWPVSMSVPGAGSGSWSFWRMEKRIQLTLNVVDFDRPANEEETNKAYAKLNRDWGSKSGMGWYFEGCLTGGREEYFYYGAILGINKAVNWVAKQGYVDRRDFVYSGQSQGGAFGIILCALNHNITKAVIGEPALTDLSGYLVDGRQSGWPTLPEKFRSLPDYAKVLSVLPYYDCAHFAKRIRIPTKWFVGFVDELCPPQAVWAGYNSLPEGVDKEIVCVPGLAHGFPSSLYWNVYDEVERRMYAH